MSFVSRVTLSATLVLAGATISSVALAKDFQFNKSAKPATEVRLMSHTSFRGQCETKAAEIVLLDQPKNGTAQVKKGSRKFPTGGKGKMALCDGKRGAAAAVFYKSKDGYQGFDQLRYKVTFSTGKTNVITYRIRVGTPKKDTSTGWTKAK